jgi:hypothetical protein
MTIPQTQAVLLSYFQTGAEPTQDEFAEFIETMFYLYNEAVNAAAAAQAAQAAAPGPVVILSVTIAGGVATLTGAQTNVASLVPSGENFALTFTTAFGNTTYKALFFGMEEVSRTDGGMVLSAGNGSGLVLIWP